MEDIKLRSKFAMNSLKIQIMSICEGILSLNDNINKIIKEQETGDSAIL